MVNEAKSSQKEEGGIKHMAKVNTKNAKEVIRYIILANGQNRLVRSDGSILLRVDKTWKKYRKVKNGITVEQYVEKIKELEREGKVIIGKTAPCFDKLRRWSEEGMCETPCGCKVELDGTCEHGNKSWLLLSGLI